MCVGPGLLLLSVQLLLYDFSWHVLREINPLAKRSLYFQVCIFAYGQTGSGKTFTMMGRPGNADKKGLIPRSLEQIFETRQSLQSQGWKYELQVNFHIYAGKKENIYFSLRN